MKAAKFEYVRPTALSDALAEICNRAAGVKLIAGSQSLGPMLNLRLARPDRVVDISRIEALRGVSIEGNVIRIGAAVTHAEIEDGKHEAIRGSCLQKVASGIAYRAVRNRGTIGGSLAHADPAADWLLALTALDARLELVSATATRQVRVSEFMVGAFTTRLATGEIIGSILVPKMGAELRWGYYKLCRKTGEFAHASAAAAFDADAKLARVILGALEGPPVCMESLALTVAREGPHAATAETIAAAVAGVMTKADEVERQLHRVAVTRCLAQAFGPALR